MELTKNQIKTLSELYNDRDPWAVETCSGMLNRVLRSLSNKGLVFLAEYANGHFWTVTWKGEEILNKKFNAKPK